MPWFESKEQKQLRLVIEDKMKLCLTKPDRYPQAINIITSYVRASNQNVIEMVVDHIKQTVKDEDIQLSQKYQAILLLKDLMDTHNKALGKYVVKKILKRLLIFAKHKQNSKDQDRGKDIFGKCRKKSQEVHGINFLNTLLLAFEDWGTKWPKNVDGPFQQFHAARNQLLMGGVQFPKERKKTIREPSPSIQRPSTSVKKKQSMEISQKPLPPHQKKSNKSASIPKQIEEYFANLVQILQMFVVTMEQNPQFSDMWATIKQIINNIRMEIQKGDGYMAKLVSQQQGDSVLYEKFEKNSLFLTNLEKNMKAVDKNSSKYSQFCSIQIKQSKRVINRLSINLQKKSEIGSSSIINRKDVPQPKVQEPPPKQQEKQQPKIRPKNRFDSTDKFQHQLENIKKQKEEFNSGSLSHQSGKFGSISGGVYDKNRFGGTNSSKQFKKEEVQEKGFKNNNMPSISKITEKNQSMIQGSKENIEKQASKQQQSFSLSHFEKVEEVPKKNEDGFDQFEEFENPKQQKPKKQEESSDFFKDQGKKQIRQRDRKKKPVFEKQNSNFFDISVKSKAQSGSFSAFGKTQSKQKEKNQNQSKQQNKQGQPITFNFDTFKNNGELPNPNFKKQEYVQSRRSSDDGNHQKKSQNPFDSKGDGIGVFTQKSKYETNPFESKNPFSQKQASQISRKNSSISNPFDEKSVSGKSQNPFDKSVVKSENPFQKSVSKDQNPFEKTVVKDEVASREENPFQKSLNKSEMGDKSGLRESNPFQKSHFKSENPFDKSVVKSENPFEKSQKKSESNPFENTQKQNISIDQVRKSPTFDVFDQSLSKKKSFTHIKRDEVQKKSDLQFANPFETDNQEKNNHIANVDPMRQSGPQFISVQNKKQSQVRNSLELMPKQYIRQSMRQSKDGFRGSFGLQRSSVKGFDLDDFTNFNKSSQSFKKEQVHKQSLKSRQSKQSKKSSINFSDFGDFGPKKSQEKQIDFFGEKSQQKQQEKSQTKKDEFDLSDFNNMSEDKQKKKEKDNFFDSMSVNSKVEKKQKQKEQKSISKSIKKEEGFDGDEWGKFGNFNDQSKVSITQSKFEDEEKKSEKEKEKQVQVRFSQFQDPEFKNTQNISEIAEEQENDANFGTLRDLKKNLQNETKRYEEPYEQSLTINLQDGSPKKKGIRWDYNMSFQPSSFRKKVSQEEFEMKREELQNLKMIHMRKIADYQAIKQQENKLRQEYHEILEHISMVQKQKYSYNSILSRIKQTNEMRQKDIEEILKKIKRGEEIKKLILEKEKLLFDRSKALQQVKSSSKIKNKSKWERFNQNLQRQKMANQESFVSYKNSAF